MSFSKTITLPTGTLSLHINEELALFEQYIDFAARNNPKRGFLFISKVLGKHYPCSPAQMLHSYQTLASLLNKSSENAQQFVFIGMAETATALALGVYETWQQSSTKPSVYCQTTRYFLDQQAFLNFQEAHTHAPDFYLYLPQEPILKQRFETADTLVLIDDEVSTGNTFANLINAYKKINPHLKQVLVLSLLNLMDNAAKERIERLTNMPIAWLSILSGSYTFQANPEFIFQLSNATSLKLCRKKELSLNYGRLGLEFLNNPNWTEILQFIQPPATLLVLGTGEFIYPAYQLGRYLETQGFTIYVQSTTRSPILLGDAIGDCLTFNDNYGDGISNFLYNQKARVYDAILLCYETPHNAEIAHLSHLLNAYSIQITHNGTVCISRP